MSERTARAERAARASRSRGGGPPRAARGPKRALTLDAIVDAGIAVAIADGLGADVDEHGSPSGSASRRWRSTATSPAKDDLLELMVDAALGRPPAAARGETWREGLLRWAAGVRDAYRANPWALRVPISAPPLGPNNMRWLENALAAMRATPLDEQEKLSTRPAGERLRAERGAAACTTSSRAAADRAGRQSGRPGHGVDRAGRVPERAEALASGALDDDDGWTASSTSASNGCSTASRRSSPRIASGGARGR